MSTLLPYDAPPRAAIWEHAFAADVCDALTDGFDHWPETGLGPRRAVTPPAQFLTPIFNAAVAVAHAFNLDVDCLTASVARYPTGDRFAPHRDMEPHWPFSYGRTVSYTVLLTDRTNFDGGELIVDGHDTNLQRGDLAAFNAVTWHEVRPVTRGDRLALIVFGHWLPNPDDRHRTAQARQARHPNRLYNPILPPQ